MSIIVSRKGEPISQTELTQEQKQAMRLAIFKAFVGLHPEIIQEAVANYHAEVTQDAAGV